MDERNDSMMSLRILLLNTQMEAAGTQKALLQLAKGLMANGHEVSVATMYDKGGYVPMFESRYHISITDLEMKRPGEVNPVVRFFRFSRGLWRLYHLIRSKRIHILQTFTHYSNIIGPFVGWLARVPVRISSQRNSLRDARGWLLKLDRTVANSWLVHKMTVVSEGTRQFCVDEQGIEPDKLLTIHNGVDTDAHGAHIKRRPATGLRQELGLDDGCRVVITVARLDRQKGHEFLIKAVPAILKAFPAVRFLFVGDGPLRVTLSTMVREGGLSDVVAFLGVREDIQELLSISDMFVLPSLWEGLPNCLLEAMALDLPVVATSVDGCPEIVIDNETGILVPPASSDKLTEAISRLLKDEGLRRLMGTAGRRRVADSFSPEANLAAYLKLYQMAVRRISAKST